MTTKRVAVAKQTMMAPSIGSRLANNKNNNLLANRSCFQHHAAVSGKEVAGAPTSKYANPFLRQRKNFNTNTSTCLLASTTSSLSSTSASIDDTSWEANQMQQTRNNQLQISRVQPRIDEPNLFDIPSNLSPTYGHLPFLLQAAIVLISALIVERRSLSRLLGILLTSTAPFSYLLSQIAQRPFTQRLFNASTIRQLVAFILRTTLLSTLATLTIQERFFPPSRVTTSYLATRGELPSTLSKYSMVLPAVVPPLLPFINNGDVGKGNGGMAVTTTTSSWNNDDEPQSPPPLVPIGVHSIQYTQSPTPTTTANSSNNNNKYDGIYLHHGFGASSLSWLPILPTLVDRLGNGKARGIAHDAPGFGFTDRPDGDVYEGLQQYGTENNVGIGVALLKESLMDVDSTSSDVGGSGGGKGGSSGSETEEVKSIAIIGHSMGCKAALLMALHCHFHKQMQLRPNLVVLVAPALEGVSLPSNNGNGNNKKLSTSRRTHDVVAKGWLSKVLHRVWVTWRKLFLDYPFQYGLRRLVW